jgi:hypothetical protein
MKNLNVLNTGCELATWQARVGRCVLNIATNLILDAKLV